MEILFRREADVQSLDSSGIDGGIFTYPEDLVEKESSSSLSMLKSLHFFINEEGIYPIY